MLFRSQVNQAIDNAQLGGGGAADSVDWSNVQNKPTIPTKTSQLTNDSSFATETYVNNKIAEAQLSGGGGTGNINDTTASATTTYSSNKIETIIGSETLNTNAQDIKGAINEVFQSVSNGKTLIASAITDKGVTTSNTDTFETMAINIRNLSNINGAIISINGTKYQLSIDDSGNIIATEYHEVLEGLIENRILVWHDEFDGDSLNLDNWDYELGVVRNNEPQYYRKENVSVSNSNLVLTAKRETFGTKEWTSGSIHSNNKAEFKNGRFEAKMKLLSDASSFPAFWLLGACEGIVYKDEQGNDIGINGCHWPYCGEIDIVEHMNDYLQLGAYYNTTNDISDEDQNYAPASQVRVGDDSINYDEYHIFALEKTKESLKFYIDDVEKLAITITDEMTNFTEQYFMILNHALKNVSNISGDVNELKILIDWVRIYAPIGDTEQILEDSISINKSDVTINVGEVQLLTAAFSPAGTQNQTLVWTSSNNEIATAEGGMLRAKKEGNCIITVTSHNKKTSSCAVEVINVNVTNITLNKTNLELNHSNSSFMVDYLESYKDFTLYSSIVTSKKATADFPQGTYIDADYNLGTTPTDITSGYIPINSKRYVSELNTNYTTLTSGWWQSAFLYDSNKAFVKQISATNTNQTKLIIDNTDGNAAYVRFTVANNGYSPDYYPMKLYEFDGFYTANEIAFIQDKNSVLTYKLDSTGAIVTGNNNISYLYPVDYPNNITYSGAPYMSVWCYDENANYLGNSGETIASTGSSYDILEGTAFIRISQAQGYSSSARFTFANTVTQSATTHENSYAILFATIEPSTVTNKEVTWSSNNANVTLDAYGDRCKVTSASSGTAIITCKASDSSGVEAYCNVAVN